MFHVVVDNDQTASHLLEALNRERAGRVTFMPLNRLNPKEVNIQDLDEAFPMIKKLRFDPLYTKAFKQVRLTFSHWCFY